MEIEQGIQPNCSSYTIRIRKEDITEEQLREFVERLEECSYSETVGWCENVIFDIEHYSITGEASDADELPLSWLDARKIKYEYEWY